MAIVTQAPMEPTRRAILHCMPLLSLASSASTKQEALMDTPDTLSPGQYAVYALVDPTDEIVYYVGLTRNPKRRLEQHLGARHHKGKKGDWLRRLRLKGQQPLMQILE